MKKYITIGFVTAVLVAIALLSWQHIKTSRDARTRQNLAGTWVVDTGSFTVRPDFSYVGQFTNSTAGKIVTNEGTFQVRDGFLIDTMTKSSGAHAHVPYITRLRIVRADAHQMVIDENDDSGDIKIVLRKDTI